MKKLLYLISLVLIIGVIITGCNIAYNNKGTNSLGESDFKALGATGDGADTVDLIAGQHIDVGDIKIWNNGESLFIEFNTTDGWSMTETHLAVATTVDDIPHTKKGNPIPGKFSHKATHNPVVGQYTYKIGLESAEFAQVEKIFVAAHADVQRIEKGRVIQQETAWGEGEPFKGRNWATYTTYVVTRNIYLTFEYFKLGIDAREDQDFHNVPGLALSPDELVLYAAHWQTSGADPIGVYSTTNYSLLYQINGGNCVGNVVTSNDGRYVYATAYYGGYIHRYDTQENEKETIDLVGDWAVNLWKSPNGERIIVLYDSRTSTANHSLALIDITDDNFSQIASFNTGRPIKSHSAAFSGDGQHIYLSAGRSGTAGPTLIDVSITGDFEIERELVLANTPNQDWQMAGVARSGGRLFVGDNTGSRLHIVSEATFEKIESVDPVLLPGNPINIAMHPDQQHLFIMYNDGTLSVMDVVTMTEIFSLSLNPGLNDAVFTADGRTVYVSHQNDEGGFSVIACPPTLRTPGRGLH